MNGHIAIDSTAQQQIAGATMATRRRQIHSMVCALAGPRYILPKNMEISFLGLNFKLPSFPYNRGWSSSLYTQYKDSLLNRGDIFINPNF